jgi:hypothetical protein
MQIFGDKLYEPNRKRIYRGANCEYFPARVQCINLAHNAGMYETGSAFAPLTDTLIIITQKSIALRTRNFSVIKNSTFHMPVNSITYARGHKIFLAASQAP